MGKAFQLIRKDPAFRFIYDDGRTQCLDSDTAVLSRNNEKDPGWNTGLTGGICFLFRINGTKYWIPS